jgi:hypothetical protein
MPDYEIRRAGNLKDSSLPDSGSSKMPIWSIGPDDGEHPIQISPDGFIKIVAPTAVTGMSLRQSGDAYDRIQMLTDGTVVTGDGTSAPVIDYDPLDQHRISGRFETIPRWFADNNSAGVLVTGVASFTMVNAPFNKTISQLSFQTGAITAATISQAQFGLYTVAANGDLTLVASSAVDTAWGGTFAATTKALTGSYNVLKGQRYAFGVLCVATTMPNYVGRGATGLAVDAALPRMNAKTTASGLTSLPASVTNANLSTPQPSFYMYA